MAKRNERLSAEARRAFASHKMLRSWQDPKDGPFRWLIGREGDSVYLADIICTFPNSIVVTGDIDLVQFSYGPPNPVARILWMGAHNDIDYYVAQKASIGSGHHTAYCWDADVAKAHLDDLIANSETEAEKTAYLELAEELPHLGSEDLFHQRASELQIDLEAIERAGVVTAPCVYYAHAALQKLCELIT